MIDGADPQKEEINSFFFKWYFYIPRNSSITISSVKPTRFCPRQTYSPTSESDIESKSRIPFECWFGNVINILSFLNQYLRYKERINSDILYDKKYKLHT